MTFSRVRAAVAAAASCVAIAPVATASQQSTPLTAAPTGLACPGTSPVTASGRAVLFTHRWNLYGCLRRGGPVSLVAEGVSPRAYPPIVWWRMPTVQGAMVAFHRTVSWKCGTDSVVVVDLARGRTVSEVPAGTYDVESGANGCMSYGDTVRSLAVRRDGVAAFIAGQPTRYEVAISGPNGLEVVASGSDIDSASLSIEYTTGYRTIGWWQAGAWQRAELPPLAG